MKTLLALVAAGSMFVSGAALAGKAPAANQSQPTGSVVTTSSTAAAISNATDASVTVVGATAAGVQVTVTATVGGSVVSVPAVASISGGTVTVTFADGSNLSFSAADFS
jgi:hypothetical protein